MDLREILKRELKENHIMQMIRCDRHIANLIANEVWEFDRQAEIILSE